jgi:uncharacterized BrkB/YihY/UPF0761 family membrane protein
MLVRIRDALARTYDDVDWNHTFQMAAALLYYFVLSVFPALILLSAVVAYLPPPDFSTNGGPEEILSDVITPNKGTFLSFGSLGTLCPSGSITGEIHELPDSR